MKVDKTNKKYQKSQLEMNQICRERARLPCLVLLVGDAASVVDPRAQELQHLGAFPTKEFFLFDPSFRSF